MSRFRQRRTIRTRFRQGLFVFGVRFGLGRGQPFGWGAGLGEDIADGDGHATKAAAFFGGLQEAIDFDGLSGGDGGDLGGEEFDDFAEHGVVITLGLLFEDVFAVESHQLVGGGVHGQFVQGVQGAGAIARPNAGHDGFSRGGGAGDVVASGTHDGEEGFGSVNGVEVEVGVMGDGWSGSPGDGGLGRG